MPTYTVLADVNERQFQNPQELIAIWGEIRGDIERTGGELVDSYALLGEYDFQLTFRVPDEDAAMQIALVIEGYGLDTKTMRSFPVDRLGELVDDI